MYGLESTGKKIRLILNVKRRCQRFKARQYDLGFSSGLMVKNNMPMQKT